MGKVRRYRQKYHLSKVRSAKTENDTKTQSSVETKSNSVGENIFAGINISYDTLTKSLVPDVDARSIVSTKSRKELKLEEQNLKKKVKRKLRHERFLQKLEVTQEAIKVAKGKVKVKAKKSLVEDLNPTSDPTPFWESLVNSKFKNCAYKSRKRPRGIMKMKDRLKQQTKDAKQMRMILNNIKFKSNPGETIIDLLKQKIASNR